METIIEIFNYFNNSKRISDTIYMTLKRMIITAQFLPDSKIDEAAISDQLGVSATSIREALKILEYNRYINFNQRIGYCVSQINLEDMVLLNDMMAMLTRASVEVISIYDRASIIMIEESLKDSGEADNYALDKKFHLTLALTTKNEEYIASMRDIYDRLEWGKNALHLPDLSQNILDEHKLIAYYLMKHDDKYRDNMPGMIDRHKLSHVKYILEKA